MKAITTDSVEFIEWVKRCEELIQKHYDTYLPTFSNKEEYTTLSVKSGRKYIKLIHNHSVWAFVNKENSDILKPASWAAPAKHARGNINDDFNGMGGITVHGPAYMRG